MVTVVLVLLALWFAASAAAFQVALEGEPRWLIHTASAVGALVSLGLLLVAMGA